MSEKLNVYDLNRRKTAVLQNAYTITETQELNKIYSLEFSIPATDEKVRYIQPFHYVRWGEEGELYRIIKCESNENDISEMKVTCEHVIATLCDTIMFGSVQYGGGTIKTADVIDELLRRQTVKNWKRGQCEFTRRFEYLWEQENLLNALYSVPKEFTKAYKWVFDTTTYQWTVSLKVIDESVHPEYYIRAKRNLLSSGSSQEFADICTRIYPLGYGEGVNQLTISSLTNDNVPYLQSPKAITDIYGIKEKVLVDRRFENAESLKEYAQTMLDALQTPSFARSFNVVDLYPLTGSDIDEAKVGDICKMTEDNTIAYITKTIRVLDDPGNLQIELSTKATDVADTIADLADRVRIESVYAQGATQIYQHSKDANAGAEKGKGMVLSLYFPSEMRQINKVLLNIDLKKFRSYSNATEGGGATSKTTEDGGATSKTSEDGGATSKTTENGGATSKTTDNGGATSTTTDDGGATSTTTEDGGGSYETNASAQDSTIDISDSTDTVWDQAGGSLLLQGSGEQSFETDSPGSEISTTTPGDTVDNYEFHTHDTDGFSDHTHYVSISDLSFFVSKSDLSHSHTIDLTGVGSHSHTIDMDPHCHSFSIPDHHHSFSIPDHNHNFSIPNHKHNFSVPDHKHKFSIPNHKHNFSIPDHTHNISPGIFEANVSATKFDIYVNDGKEPALTVNSTSYNGNITSLLLTNGQIQRNSWIKIEIVPNQLAYVVSSVFVQGFVQSRGGGNY